MGLQQSKDELLYQQVSYGNPESIRSLRNEGAGLEWIDKEGKTPLILACMNPELYNVAKTLIELGANVNAYRPGRQAGTPLHHAAKRGLEQTVKLLLSHGANALVMNDDCQTPLDVARVKGYSNVVRAIENHLCLFSGWLQELYGPGFLELLAPQLLSRKVWVVILPCGARRLSKPFKLELALYSSLQDAKPRTIIALWKANMDEPNFNQPDPSVIISSSNIPRRWRLKRGILTSQVRQSRVKLAPVNEREKQQLQMFCNACKGIPQVTNPAFPFNNQGSGVGPATQTTLEDTDLALAISASLQSGSQIRPTAPDLYHGSGSSTSTGHNSETTAHNGKSQYVIHDMGSSTSTGRTNPRSHNGETTAHNGKSQYVIHDAGTGSTSEIVPNNPIAAPTPSAPPFPDTIEEEGTVQYPSIDLTPVNLSSSVEETAPAKAGEREKDNNDSSTCVICLDAPIEGACIPCGHMAGCMSCLNEIKGKKWGCPVCRTKIDQIVRLYAV